MTWTRNRVEELLESADLRVGGDRPWDPVVHDERFFERFPAEGSIGLGEAYMDGWWSSERVDQTIHRMLEAGLQEKIKGDPRLAAALLWARLANRQSRRRAREVAERHYDLDADLYMAFLDRWNQYTCGYWRGLREGETPRPSGPQVVGSAKGTADPAASRSAQHGVAASAAPSTSVEIAPPRPAGSADAAARRASAESPGSPPREQAAGSAVLVPAERARTLAIEPTTPPGLLSEALEVAQESKLHLICRKLQLQPGDRVLDIGCGWGGFARFAAEYYGARVTGVTISSGQAAHARQFCAGLDVDIIEMDYRDIPGRLQADSFDRVLVCGMIEHVGYKNYRSLMASVAHALRERGLFLLHTIGRDTSSTMMTTHRWIDRYIFPNGMIPSLQQLTRAMEGLFVVEDLHQFGSDHYDRTLMAWHQNFERSWGRLKERYDERFRRMWNFYLLSCAGGFRAGLGRLWQIVMSKHGVQEGYLAVR